MGKRHRRRRRRQRPTNAVERAFALNEHYLAVGQAALEPMRRACQVPWRRG